MAGGLRVVEVFESLQGEGPFCCRRALFVRLAGCNLRCPFCDTGYSLDPRSGRVAAFGELVERASGHSLVVVTGGEPLLQRSQLNMFIEQLWEHSPGVDVQLETNGTLPAPRPEEMLYDAYHVVSPKDIPVSVPGARTHPSWIEYARLTGRAWFKFLARTREDVEKIAAWARENSVEPSRVYVMPLTPSSYTAGELLELHRELAREALSYGLNFSPRMHLLLGLA